MPDLVIEQALYGGQDAGGYRFLARSAGFLEEWLPEAQRLCTGFGERPAGGACPACVFAQPFGKRHVAVVQVADQGVDDTGRPGALGFHLLVLPHTAYADLGGDPFAVAERFPPSWQQRGELPSVTWPDDPLPHRTVEQVRKILEPVEEGPGLLGAAQALVDGGRIVFERPAPDTDLLRRLWTLLPTSTRCHLWPASFAFGNALGFDALVVPHAAGEAYTGYLTDAQSAEYPQGHYELHLQIAAEAGDQGELDALLARRSRKETWRLGVFLLVVSVVLVLAGNWLIPTPAPVRPPASAAKLELPAADTYPTLSVRDRHRVTLALYVFAEQLGVKPLSRLASPEKLLEQVDDRLGLTDPARDPVLDLASGPLQRRLQALLWKHGVAEYRDPKLNPVELVERLQKKVAANQPHGKKSR